MELAHSFLESCSLTFDTLGIHGSAQGPLAILALVVIIAMILRRRSE